MKTLPEKWCVKDCEIVSKYAASKYHCHDEVMPNYFYENLGKYGFLTKDEILSKGYTEISLQDFKELVLMETSTFVLPTEWQIMRDKENYLVVNAWMNKHHKKKHNGFGYYEYDHGSVNNVNLHKSTEENFPIITFEQFKLYVLKIPIMKTTLPEEYCIINTNREQIEEISIIYYGKSMCSFFKDWPFFYCCKSLKYDSYNNRNDKEYDEFKNLLKFTYEEWKTLYYQQETQTNMKTLEQQLEETKAKLAEIEKQLKEKNSPKFKVGDYIKGGKFNEKHIGKIISIDDENIYHYWGYNVVNDFQKNDWYAASDSKITLATTEEIKEFLIKVAKEKGFDSVCTIDKSSFEYTGICKIWDLRGAKKFHYNEKTDTLLITSPTTDEIYKEGKWATIVVEKAIELPFGNLTFIINKKEQTAKCAHGTITKDEIQKVVDWYNTDIQLLGYDMQLESAGTIYIKFGCCLGTKKEANTILEVFTS